MKKIKYERIMSEGKEKKDKSKGKRQKQNQQRSEFVFATT